MKEMAADCANSLNNLDSELGLLRFAFQMILCGCYVDWTHASLLANVLD